MRDCTLKNVCRKICQYYSLKRGRGSVVFLKRSCWLQHNIYHFDGVLLFMSLQNLFMNTKLNCKIKRLGQLNVSLKAVSEWHGDVCFLYIACFVAIYSCVKLLQFRGNQLCCASKRKTVKNCPWGGLKERVACTFSRRINKIKERWSSSRRFRDVYLMSSAYDKLRMQKGNDLESERAKAAFNKKIILFQKTLISTSGRICRCPLKTYTWSIVRNRKRRINEKKNRGVAATGGRKR